MTLRTLPEGRSRKEAPAVSKSLAEQAYDHLEEMIVTLQLKPGSILNESALTQQIGFGRTPVREALLRLSDVGLISIVPRRGTLVTTTDRDDQLLLLEVRRELERLIASKAAARRDALAKRAFEEMALDMREASRTDDYLLFLRVDHRFNQFVAMTSANRHLIKAIMPIHALARRFWYMHYRPYDLPTAATLHAVIMEAIAAGDAAAAGRASDMLLDYVENFTRAVPCP
ncbi:GntR family transcriptional regulator [Methylobacterium sp. NEAU 140]|uniref:GntR family transcriptional regulator n=1 Tax=Methylobacterium sp. NEAU 140 TaxID=3064945 RepID=UPI002732B6E4|nr:GntR family transcriptional regulator [Methylobacterium sp. NEAU 140]MDP4026373.1 GntR family transcriptional regulator [Methylobacterium sp. NEAU 140]